MGDREGACLEESLLLRRQIEIQVIEASNIEARLSLVYRGDHTAGSYLVGSITGPRCPTARTLPTTIALTTGHRGDPLAVEAIVPEPCFWSPDQPFLYDVSLELRQGNQARMTGQFSIALFRQHVRKQ